MYLQLSVATDDNALRHQALVRAAELYRKSGQTGSAIDALERHVNGFSGPQGQLVNTYQRLAELNQADGNEIRRLYWLRQLVAAEKAAAATADEPSHLLAAEASLVLAEQQAVDFRRIRLVHPLKQSLLAKLRALQSALEGFEQAMSYAVSEVTSASTYQIAGMYRELHQSLLTSERPSGLNQGELSQYEALLADRAVPFQRKEIEIHETNVRRIVLGEYDIWIDKSLKRLAQLWPIRYAKEERSEPLVEIQH